MTRPTLVPILLAALVALTNPSTTRAQESDSRPVWSTLDAAGLTVHALFVPDAPKQAMFTLHAFGLADEPAGRAQYAHLLEHMLIRTTDPRALSSDGLSINGETTGDRMRVETIASPDRWQEAVERHARWLTAEVTADTTFDAKALAVEKTRIEAEERSTVGVGATHKWALAAWSQALTGLDHAAVHGAVAAATPAELADYASTVFAPQRAVVVTAGPIEPARVVDHLRSALGDAFPESAGEPTPPVPATVDELPEHATWDLSARHELAWVPLPDDADRAASVVATRMLGVLAAMDPELRSAGQPTLVQLVQRGTTRYVIASRALTGDSEPRLGDAWPALMKRATAYPNRETFGLMQANGLTPPRNLSALRARLATRGSADWLEANLALQTATIAAQLGVPPSDAVATLRAVDADALDAVVEALASATAHTLVLTPE